MNVRQLMQPEVVTLRATDTLDLADDIMRLGRIRHLPVVDADERVVGILSQRDLFRAGISSILQMHYTTERDFLAEVAVAAVMTPNVVCVGPDASLRAAVELMLTHRVGCVAVVEDRKLVGLVSETDCLRHLAHLLGVAQIKDALPELERGS
jgi:CBS domain-containing protein